MPSWELAACCACSGPVSHRKDQLPERKGLCRPCWGDPLKRAAALFGDEDEDAIKSDAVTMDPDG